MASTKRSTWIGGSVVVTALLVAAAWLLAISPAFTAAAEVRDETLQTQERNDLLQMKVTKLAADFRKLDEYKAELAGLQVQVPVELALSDLLRGIEETAVRHGVVVTALASNPPVTAVAPVGAAPAAAEPVADGTADEGATATEGEDAAAVPAPPAGVAVPGGLVSVPLTITVVGGYEATLAFLDDLQNVIPRLVLVTDVTGTSQEESPASGGKPETARGDQELTLSAFAYVLPDPAAPPATDGETAPAPLPGPVPGKNPLVPAAGE